MPYARPEIMLIKNTRFRRPLQIMDPDCAICSQPALAQCECEAKGLDIAVRQAEQRMMTQMFNDIRTWVRGHAQDYILQYFSMLTTRRKDQHAQILRQINERAAYYYNARPHPSEIAHADAELKRGIDDDWKQSVQRYPEVLEYFYGLVDLNLPHDEDPAVRDPPLSALGGGSGARKVRVRSPDPREREREREPEVRRRERRRSIGRRERERGPPVAAMGVAPPSGHGRRQSTGFGGGPGYSYVPSNNMY
ncbi:hypothetical protein HYFRA_00002270 [Hymenoscyphus fraxineus]|uniref:Uncharacterized protein n=1 Tax=Hymenoscyphus fraxineus TaxID=746836 RepID=A0A9N9L781_9HELO|nr:hypothetical protein HYFRA_00002270 [Hymenoscyphus fraxineus]